VAPGYDVTVVGLDDTITSTGYGMSTYNFNVSALAVAKVDYIIRGAHKRSGRPDPTNVVEIPGTVVQRGSTGQCRRM
jgi:hypothetical protein